MSLKLRILTHNNEYVSASNSTQELLKVLFDIQMGTLLLNSEEEDSLRGWLLLQAQALNMGENVPLEGQDAISVGKTADGRPFVRDARGDWPPIKPDFD